MANITIEQVESVEQFHDRRRPRRNALSEAQWVQDQGLSPPPEGRRGELALARPTRSCGRAMILWARCHGPAATRGASRRSTAPGKPSMTFASGAAPARASLPAPAEPARWTAMRSTGNCSCIDGSVIRRTAIGVPAAAQKRSAGPRAGRHALGCSQGVVFGSRAADFFCAAPAADRGGRMTEPSMQEQFRVDLIAVHLAGLQVQERSCPTGPSGTTCGSGHRRFARRPNSAGELRRPTVAREPRGSPLDQKNE